MQSTVDHSLGRQPFAVGRREMRATRAKVGSVCMYLAVPPSRAVVFLVAGDIHPAPPPIAWTHRTAQPWTAFSGGEPDLLPTSASTRAAKSQSSASASTPCPSSRGNLRRSALAACPCPRLRSAAAALHGASPSQPATRRTLSWTTTAGPRSCRSHPPPFPSRSVALPSTASSASRLVGRAIARLPSLVRQAPIRNHRGARRGMLREPRKLCG